MLKIPSVVCLSVIVSCQSVPDRQRRLIVEQCSPYIVYESVEVLRDGQLVAEHIVDETKSNCNCRRYKYSLSFMGPIANTVESKPLFYCSKLIGNPPDEYIKTVNFLGDLRRDLEQAR